MRNIYIHLNHQRYFQQFRLLARKQVRMINTQVEIIRQSCKGLVSFLNSEPYDFEFDFADEEVP
jgi:hypothetical protein